MVRRLRALVERLLPWWSTEQAAERDRRTAAAIARLERVTKTPGALGAYDGYRVGRR